MALTTTPTDYANLCTGSLATAITTTTATGFVVTADSFVTPAGTGATTWPTGPQIWKISRKTRTNTVVEFVGVETATQSGATVTTGAVNRYLPANGSSLSSQGNGLAFPAGSTVELVWHAYTAEKVPYKDVANTFTAIQTLTELDFTSGTSYIKTTDSGTNLKFKDGSTAEQTLSALAAAAGSDHKLLNTAADTTANYLNSKLLVTAPITKTTNNAGGNETLTLALTTPFSVANGGTGVASLATGALPLGAGTSAMTAIGPGTNGQVPVSNGSTLAMGTAGTYTKVVYMNYVDSSNASSGGVFDTYTYTIPANDLIANVAYEIEGGYTVSALNTNFQPLILLGGASVSNTNATGGSSTGSGCFRCIIYGTAAAAASVAVRSQDFNTYLSTASGGSGSGNFATNGTLAITVKANAGTSCTAKLTSMVIKRISTVIS